VGGSGVVDGATVGGDWVGGSAAACAAQPERSESAMRSATTLDMPELLGR
jgi:hypothetical protein